jgi:3-methylfumaryl-CoA hydratase
MPKDGEDAAVGRVREVRGGVTREIANMLGATLRQGWTSETLMPGDPLPPLWHWAAFPQDAPMEEIGPDGHPALGAFLPDLGLGRRMWAGGTVRFLRTLHVGEPLAQRSEIVSVVWKSVAGAPMAIVTLDHVVSGEDGAAIEERQNIVYLPLPTAFRPPKPIPAPGAAAFDDVVAVDAVRLFRYSAATFNGHRIHYDRAYATGVEHYPGLVVHGPLQATLLVERAVTHRGGNTPVEVTHRGVHPCFDHHAVRLVGVEDGPGTMRLCTAAPPRDGGHQCMQVTAVWA